MCPICASQSQFKLKTKKYNYDIFSCNNKECNHYFYKDFYPGQGVDQREENVENESDNTLNTFKDRNERLLRYLLKQIPSKLRYTFLDFGSGVAHISRVFKNSLKEKVEIYCFEPNEKLEGFYKKFKLIQILELKIEKNNYDLIYLIEVIEHLDNPKQVLMDLKNVMNEGTKLFITTPKAEDYDLGDCYDNPSHIHFFTENSLNFLLNSLGFKKMKFRYVPEMYPFDLFTFRKEKLKSIFINFFLMTGFKIDFQFKNHLVGFTQIK